MTPRREINKYVRKWIKILGLTDWIIRVEVTELPAVGDEPATASCTAQPEYKTATLTFCLSLIEANGERIEPLVVHELSHCLTWPLTRIADLYAGADEGRQEMSRIATESVTTTVANLLYSLRKE